MPGSTSRKCSARSRSCTSSGTSTGTSSQRYVLSARVAYALIWRSLTGSESQNFLIDTTGHIKLTDFGLAAGALNPGKIEHMKHKVRSKHRCALPGAPD